MFAETADAAGRCRASRYTVGLTGNEDRGRCRHSRGAADGAAGKAAVGQMPVIGGEAGSRGQVVGGGRTGRIAERIQLRHRRSGRGAGKNRMQDEREHRRESGKAWRFPAPADHGAQSIAVERSIPCGIVTGGAAGGQTETLGGVEKQPY